MAALAAILLTGCVTVPSSGPVESGLTGPAPVAREPLVRPIANPPLPGMTQLEVVAGFLGATAAVGDDFQVARQYLTEQASQAWNPGAGVTVVAVDSQELSQAGAAVRADFDQVATVSASGVLNRQPAAGSSWTLPMESVDGEWRISQAPDGLLLTSEEFQRAFEARSTYFLDPGGSTAVPDMRVVPRTGRQALATALVAALLAGPSQWLAPAVSSAIPGGMQLALGAVPVANGVARVDLQGPPLASDRALVEQFGAQFAWTLRQVPGLVAMEVSVNGRAVPLQQDRGPVQLAVFDGYTPDVIEGGAPLYGLTQAGTFAAVQDGAVRELDRPGIAGMPPASSVAVDPSGQVIAGAAADRSGMLLGALRPEGSALQTIGGQVGSGPSIDAAQRVWWCDGQGRVLVAAADGSGQFAAAVVPVAGAAGPVRLIRPSRDGTRAALLVGDGPARSVLIGVVVAGADGLRIEGVSALGSTGGAGDLAWHDADEITVLLPGSGAMDRVDLLGNRTVSFAVPQEALSVTDAPDDAIALGLGDGSAGWLTGNGVRIVEGLRAPAYPG